MITKSVVAAVVAVVTLLAGVFVAVSPAGAAVGNAFIKNRSYTGSGLPLCLTAYGNTSGSSTTLDDCRQSSYQLWTYPSPGAIGSIRLDNSASQCLTRVGGSSVELKPCSQASSQLWKMHPTGQTVGSYDVGIIGQAGAVPRLDYLASGDVGLSTSHNSSELNWLFGR